MEVKFWQPAREYKKYKREIDEAMQGCLERGELVLGFGEEIPRFEKSFADYIGVKHAIMCGSGTQALCLAYAAIGIGPGDEVITTSHTFVATIDQIKKLGATPVLVDIGDDGLIDPMLIEKAITPRTKAIVPVHLEGKVCDMHSIIGIANRYGLRVIEDSAQAIGATYGGKRAGSFGDAGCYSFFPAKILGCAGNGGAVVTNDDKIAERARLLRCNYNIGKNHDRNVEYGWNLEPDTIHAAVLNVKMKYLDQRIARRKVIAKMYDDAFRGLWGLVLPVKQEGRVYQDYILLLPNQSMRDQFHDHLEKCGVKTLGHNLWPNHSYPNLGLHFNLPKTEEYLSNQIRIPCNPDLEDKEVKHIIQSVADFFKVKKNTRVANVR